MVLTGLPSIFKTPSEGDAAVFGITKVYVKPDAPKFIFVAAAIKPLSVFPVAPKLVPFQTDLVKV